MQWQDVWRLKQPLDLRQRIILRHFSFEAFYKGYGVSLF